jgi:hypothetical protein
VSSSASLPLLDFKTEYAPRGAYSRSLRRNNNVQLDSQTSDAPQTQRTIVLVAAITALDAIAAIR